MGRRDWETFGVYGVLGVFIFRLPLAVKPTRLFLRSSLVTPVLSVGMSPVK